MAENFQAFLEDFIDWVNGQEAGLVKMKMQIAKLLGEKQGKDLAKLPFDVLKIKWQQRQNQKGPFEISEDYDNADHKVLLKFLTEHTGNCLVSQGFFMWVFPDLKTCGRKRSELCRKGRA